MTATTNAAAVLARLNTDTRWTVLDGNVKTTPTGAYVVLYDEPVDRWAGRLVGLSDRKRWTFRLVCVGADPNQARWAATLADTLLTDWRLSTAQTDTWLRRTRDNPPILRDDTVPNDIRFSQTLTFYLSSST